MSDNSLSNGASPESPQPFNMEQFHMAWVAGIAHQYAEYIANPSARETRIGPNGIDLRDDRLYRGWLDSLTHKYDLDGNTPLVSRLIAGEKDNRGQHDRAVATLAAMVAGREFSVELTSHSGKPVRGGFPLWQLDREGRIPRGNPYEPIAVSSRVIGQLVIPRALNTNSLTVFLSPGQFAKGRFGFPGRSFNNTYAHVWPVFDELSGVKNAEKVTIVEQSPER